jgi:hypothetical protein
MSRDMPGHCRDIPGQSRRGLPGQTGTHPLRGVPVSRLPRVAGFHHLSESESTGPSYRGAVGGTLSRNVELRTEK